MTIFEMIKSLSFEELAEWLSKNCDSDTSPWILWADRTQCENCEPIVKRSDNTSTEQEYSYCEVYHKCKFFPEFDCIPENIEIIKLWLNSTIE